MQKYTNMTCIQNLGSEQKQLAGLFALPLGVIGRLWSVIVSFVILLIDTNFFEVRLYKPRIQRQMQPVLR